MNKKIAINIKKDIWYMCGFIHTTVPLHGRHGDTLKAFI